MANTMSGFIHIHKSLLPKKVQRNLKGMKWLSGTIFFDKFSAKADFIDEKGKVLFQFSRPTVIAHTSNFIRYVAVVFTGTNDIGVEIGELCELTFHFKLPVLAITNNTKHTQT